MSTDTKPTNVVAALAKIMEELPAISKAVHDGAIKYPYRGIEEITNEAQALFAKYGVVPVPTEIKQFTVKDIVVNGNPWTDTQVVTRWRYYGPGGIEDFIDAETLSFGRDNSDKGANKAATQGFKYLLLPSLMVADPKDDGDRETHTADRSAATPPAAARQAQGTGNARQRPAPSAASTSDSVRGNPAPNADRKDYSWCNGGNPPVYKEGNRRMTDPQRKRLGAICGNHQVDVHEAVHSMYPKVATTNDLTTIQVSYLMDAIEDGWKPGATSDEVQKVGDVIQGAFGAATEEEPPWEPEDEGFGYSEEEF